MSCLDLALEKNQRAWLGLEHYSQYIPSRMFGQEIDWAGLDVASLKELVLSLAKYDDGEDPQAHLIPYIHLILFDKTNEIEQLRFAIEHQETLNRVLRHDDERTLHNLVCLQARRFEATGVIEDLQAAIKTAKKLETKTTTPYADTQGCGDLSRLQRYEFKMIRHTSTDVVEAPCETNALRELVRDTEIMNPFFEGDYSPMLRRLKEKLSSTVLHVTEWVQLLDTCGLTQMLVLGKSKSISDANTVGAFEPICSEFRNAGMRPRHLYLVCLATSLSRRCYILGGTDVSFIEKAIAVLRDIIDAPDHESDSISGFIASHPFMAALQSNSGEQAGKYLAVVRDLTENLDISRLYCVGLLGSLMEQRHTALGDPADLREAVKLLEERWRCSKDKSAMVLESGVLLVNCYVSLLHLPAEDEDNDTLLCKAIALFDDLLGHPVEPHLRVQLLVFRCKLYEIQWGESGDFGLLETAIKLAESLRDQVPYDKGEAPVLLGTLMQLYLDRSLLRHDSSDIERAFALSTEALDIADSLTSSADLTGDDVLFSRSRALHEAASCLRRLYEFNRDRNFVEEAIRLSTKAVELSRGLEKEAPNQVVIHRTLADLHVSLVFRTGDGKKLTDCIEWCRQAIRDSGANQHLQNSLKGSLAHYLAVRYANDKNAFPGDLIESIDLARNALDEFERSSLFLFLHSKTGKDDLLDEAIDIAKRALPDWEKQSNRRRLYGIQYGQKPADWVSGEFTLARAILHRMRTPSEPWSDNTEVALNCLLRCSRATTQNIMETIKSAVLLSDPIFVSSGKLDFADLADATEKAVHLLPTYSSRALKREDVKDLLFFFAGLPAAAAASAIETGRGAVKALRLLETGRGILTTYLLDTRQDIWDIGDGTDAELVSRLKQYLAELELVHASQTADGAKSRRNKWQVDRTYRLNAEVNNILEQLKSQGQDVSLGLPNAAEFQAVGHKDGRSAVVVINVHFRSDAILIHDNIIETIPLPRLGSENARKAAKYLEQVQKRTLSSSTQWHIWSIVLKWLWDVAVEPVLDHLGYTTTPCEPKEWPRVWWVPTGEATQLPFHAAGIHKPHSTSSALDRVVSSYSSSVKALLYTQGLVLGQRTALDKSRTSDSNKKTSRVVLASMSTTPSQQSLKYVKEEVSEVSKSVERSSSTVKELIQPVKEDVMTDLKSCDVFHFAGHGASYSKDPDSSCLLVEDWQTNPLTVKDVLSLKLHERAPFLAYLSACSTGANKTEGLSDESIHLVTAFQLAGFQHVIGSLWAISDYSSSVVAKHVYDEMNGRFEPGVDVSLALHSAVRKLREAPSQGTGSRSTDIIEAKTDQILDEEGMLDDNDLMRELEKDSFLADLSRSWSREFGDEVLGALRDPRPNSVRRPLPQESTMRNPVLWAPYFHTGY